MSKDMGTPAMDIGTSGQQRAELVPNDVLRKLREERGWGRPRLARELHRFCAERQWSSPGESNIAKQIYRLESGRSRLPDEFYAALYCQFYQRSEHELFGTLRGAENHSDMHRIRSHKFIPAYVGPEAVQEIFKQRNMLPDHAQWIECTGVHDDESDGSRLYAWPFGVLVFHLVEDLTPKTIAEVAVWRQRTYRENAAWAACRIGALTSGVVEVEPYVLSAYWAEASPHDESRRDTALRLLCMPRTLLERDDAGREPSESHAALVEQQLLAQGFDHPGISEFGIKGISSAYASWSGVVYHPIAPERALTEQELVTCELTIQSIWSYCDYIRGEVEDGRDPLVPDEYGWRFLRGVRSRITTERPLETSQHRSMRNAIVATSGLAEHLAQAVETLREAQGDRG